MRVRSHVLSTPQVRRHHQPSGWRTLACSCQAIHHFPPGENPQKSHGGHTVTWVIGEALDTVHTSLPPPGGLMQVRRIPRGLPVSLGADSAVFSEALTTSTGKSQCVRQSPRSRGNRMNPLEIPRRSRLRRPTSPTACRRHPGAPGGPATGSSLNASGLQMFQLQRPERTSVPGQGRQAGGAPSHALCAFT